jgi:hypothetical protein
MASKRKTKDPTRAEFLLRGASARYQTLLLNKIGSLYKNDDKFPSLDSRRKINDKDQLRRYELINSLIAEYGEVYLNDLRYNYGVDNTNWRPTDYSAEDKEFINKEKGVKPARKEKKTLFQNAQAAIIGAKYNYCGSGTPIGKYLSNGNPPSTLVDFYCMIHDIQYLTISARGLPDREVNKLARKADIELQEKTEALVGSLGGEFKALGADATTVSSGMIAKMFFEDIPKSPIKARKFIPPLPVARKDIKQLDELKTAAGKALIESLEYGASKPDMTKPDGIDGLFEREVSEKRVKAIDSMEFRKIASALSELKDDSTPFDFKKDRRKDKKFKDELKLESVFFKDFFKDDNEEIDEYAKTRSLTSKAISPQDSPTYKDQPDPVFLGEGPLESEGLAETGAGKAPAAPLIQAEEERKHDTDPEEPPPPAPAEEGEELIDPSDPIKETPINLDELRKQRDRVGQEERVDLKADPPMSAMAMTDAKPVIGERNMRPTLFREEGDTVKLSNAQEQENRLFYENFTWIDAGFGNGNIQRIPGEAYAGKDIANNRLYDAQVKNEMLKYSGDLFVGTQQYRKKYNVSRQTRNLVRRPMFSTVQHHQQFIRDSSLPAGAGRYHQMARDNPSWIPSKNVNSKVGHLFYPDVVDGQRL